MIKVTDWPDMGLVSAFTSSPVMVVLSPIRRVSGVKVIERIVPVFVVGTNRVKVEDLGAEVLLPSEARAYKV